MYGVGNGVVVRIPVQKLHKVSLILYLKPSGRLSLKFFQPFIQKWIKPFFF